MYPNPHHFLSCFVSFADSRQSNCRLDMFAQSGRCDSVLWMLTLYWGILKWDRTTEGPSSMTMFSTKIASSVRFSRNWSMRCLADWWKAARSASFQVWPKRIALLMGLDWYTTHHFRDNLFSFIQTTILFSRKTQMFASCHGQMAHYPHHSCDLWLSASWAPRCRGREAME